LQTAVECWNLQKKGTAGRRKRKNFCSLTNKKRGKKVRGSGPEEGQNIGDRKTVRNKKPQKKRSARCTNHKSKDA